MQYDRNSIEKKINQSAVFQLEPGSAGYRREALKLVELLFHYLMVIGKGKYDDFGVEITETANRCIKNYNVGAGPFLNYFNAAWKLEYGHAVGRGLVGDNYVGIKFTDAIQRKLRGYLKYASSRGMDTESAEFENNVRAALGLSGAEYRELVTIVKNRTISEHAKNAAGEEYSVFDRLETGTHVSDGIIKLETMESVFGAIETNYNRLQDRQKPILRDLITLKISELIAGDEPVIRLVQAKSFFNKELYIRCVSEGITARHIAEKYSIKEQSLSRTWKQFKEKLADSIGGELNGLK